MMERFLELMEKGNVDQNDLERVALLLIIAGCDELFDNAGLIYNFKEGYIETDCFSKHEFSYEAKKLIKIGFNLYNGEHADLLDSLYGLSEANFELAFKAIKVRLNREVQNERVS